ncbi:hypothetical protein [Nitrosovibrio sp. Nv4]|uniref:hypothetical protein n=1 Tax=Nitrosovibrio sp. Nv4 TaxID=1945880 RepID=UPI000BD4C149|nr:hypothetical protein [Nitrosovibrio sp. Nv4]SOD42574.1 hypothetical protein SAMN06298226_2922 [Nitrosovibrio sp. Nv4]
MGWKGTVRSIGVAYRAAERDAKRRQRGLEQQRKQYEKMQELEQAAYEVDVYQNHIDVIQSVHKECGTLVDWKAMASAPEPEKPKNLREREARTKAIAANYQPGFTDKLFKREDKKRKKLADEISKAIEDDESENINKIENWEREYSDWSKDAQLARGILNNDIKSKLTAIEKLDPFSEISTLGSSLSFKIAENSMIETTINIYGVEVIPNEVKSLLKSGHLSVKQMPKSQFNEIYQDYVCSCVLRVANELFSILPDEMVFVTAVDKLLNSKTGHLEEAPILSACVSRNTLQSLNMDNIDSSDCMSNFIHNMSFKKTKGFEAVERLEPGCLQNRT